MYGTMYGVKRTTVFLPEDLKAELKRAAEAEGCSEAELIRTGVRQLLDACRRPRPRIPLYASGKPGVARDVDEALKGTDDIPGFGEW